MSTQRSTRWTARTTLATCTVALSLGVWSIGCDEAANTTVKSDETSTGETVLAKVESQKTRIGTKTAAGKEPEENSPQPEKPAVDSRLKVKRLVVTHDVEQREPVAVDTLSTDKQVVAFVELANDGADVAEIEITFVQEGKPPVGHIKLEVPGEKPHWRTWARTRQVRTPGEWEAVVSTNGGAELARTKFVVGEG
ncbi:MAG: DUF2914 domain-containing protein [Polyangiaceae bacterium]|nr:DUF2914 domain-containing protein [Polyangiaceae bacterium]